MKDLDLVTIIVKYNNNRRLGDAIDFIDTNKSKLYVRNFVDALKWANKNPKDYKYKSEKAEALLDYLNNEYMQ